MPFSSLGLSPGLAAAMLQQHFTAPTPVQAAALGPALAGQDVVVCAQTGSGKTAAYALALLQRWQPAQPGTPRRPQALVLVPTRELAVQVGAVINTLARAAGLAAKVSVVFGGTVRRQID
jgi:superfamily II DNA/RNA helicase